MDRDIQYGDQLNDVQKDLVRQAFHEVDNNKSFRGLCLNMPMGCGKTRTMSVIGVNLYRCFLVVCSKTLLGNWANELRKVFGDKIKFEIVHRDYQGAGLNTWIRGKNTRVVLTTSEMICRSYRYHNLQNSFVYKRDKVNHYRVPRIPLGPKGQNGPEQFHSIEWEGVVIDESQNYTNSKTLYCHAISALCCKHRWLLSGTPLQEPSVERVLGFFMLLNQTSPDNLPEVRRWMSGGRFPGLADFSLCCAAPNIESRLVQHEEIYEM